MGLGLTTAFAASYEDLTYQTKFFNNTLDHLAPFQPSQPTYSQRYLVNDDFFGQKDPLSDGCPGPIFLYTGNEGPITAFWDSNGFMKYLAEKYGGLLLFFEERYYGESIPTEECCTYLTTQQVLEDYVELLLHVKKDYNAVACPTIAFGGSYGATLAAYMRLAYPFSIQGALASSSELGYYDAAGWEAHNVTSLTFSEIIGKQYNKTEGCLKALWNAVDIIDATDDETLLTTFNFCNVSALKPMKSSIFTYALEGLPQGNYPYPIGSMPAWPVNYSCSILTDESIPLLQRAANVTALSMGYALDGDCLNSPEEGPGNIPGDGPGLTSWGYQSCTETIHVFNSIGRGGSGVRDFSYDVEIGKLKQNCIDLYDQVPNTDVLAMRYGGFDIGRTTSNTIFSTGLIDPWGGAGISAQDGGDDATERGVHFFAMEDAAHHLDLRGWNDADPPNVTATRNEEEEIIMGWVRGYATKNGDEYDKVESDGDTAPGYYGNFFYDIASTVLTGALSYMMAY
jgi:hypothetical protein